MWRGVPPRVKAHFPNWAKVKSSNILVDHSDPSANPFALRDCFLKEEEQHPVKWEWPSLLDDCCYVAYNFYVTSTMYQSKKVISKKTEKPANLPGPAMFHTTKTQRDYLYFAHTLLESNHSLEQIVLGGGDRDKAQSLFLKPLKGSTFLSRIT